MSRLAILGCGYVGKLAASLWKAKGHAVTVSTRKSERQAELLTVAGQVNVFTEDPQQSLQDLLKDQEMLLVCVAPDSIDSYKNTYLDTALLLSATVDKFPNLKQIIYTSSTSVYGDQNGACVDENTPTKPENPSAEILVETENAFIEMASLSRKVCILRLGEIIGPGRELVERLRKNGGRPFPGNGENWTNLIHVNDVVRGIDFILENQLTGVYNLCQDLHVLRKDLYTSLCKEYNIPAVSWNPAQKSLHAGNKRVSNNKIKQAGFQISGSQGNTYL